MHPRHRPRPAPVEIAESDTAAARALVAGARRPAIVAGAQARRGGAQALAALADALACPVLTTYKAKGVYPDGAPRHAGLFTGGAAEAPWLAECDLAIFFGVDPVELVASPWPYGMPALELATAAVRPHYADIAVSLEGDLAALAREVAAAARPANWPFDPKPGPLPEAPAAAGTLSPQAVARAAAAALPEARITIDAGAHMLAPLSEWPAREPFDAQISNGLSTMGFALPAAIATALAEPGRRVVAFTGDGGLAMCLSELATAARLELPITVVVFNDARLALIDAKQAQRGFAPRGMRYPGARFRSRRAGPGLPRRARPRRGGAGSRLRRSPRRRRGAAGDRRGRRPVGLPRDVRGGARRARPGGAGLTAGAGRTGPVWRATCCRLSSLCSFFSSSRARFWVAGFLPPARRERAPRASRRRGRRDASPLAAGRPPGRAHSQARKPRGRGRALRTRARRALDDGNRRRRPGARRGVPGRPFHRAGLARSRRAVRAWRFRRRRFRPCRRVAAPPLARRAAGRSPSPPRRR